ncbi:MAG: class I SAM-dependent methyltransferase [Pseudomonadota bacterium]
MKKALYDTIGKDYVLGRRTDPRIAAEIHRWLQGAESVLNLGAGSGSYEPPDCRVAAVEPSETMIRQRPATSAPAIRAQAENLPFPGAAFSHCMTVLSMHHWQDREKAFAEIRRVTRKRFVAVTWDPEAEPFWLTRDYFPELVSLDRTNFPTIDELSRAFAKISVNTLPIPADCIDGFLAAYWRRPEAYLDERVRNNISTFSKISDVESGLAQLAADLKSGAWESRNQADLKLDAIDVGYRVICADLTSP